jgi:hypothetical protein
MLLRIHYEVHGESRRVARIAEMRNTYKMFVSKMKGKDTSENLGKDRREILTCMSLIRSYNLAQDSNDC